jgi:hypothetical protein
MDSVAMDAEVGAFDTLGCSRPNPDLTIHAVAMIKNEADIIRPFLMQCAELFDCLFVANVQSTDGTTVALRSFSDPRMKLHVFDVEREERYQSEVMNLLTREAFARGADWVFCLDADEFLAVESRSELEDVLTNLGADVMMMPWMNLAPTQFGSFTSFDVTQDFFWSGRTSVFSKVALSSIFAANNPQYYIQQGNHSVSPVFGAEEIYGQPGLPLLHLPVRSLDRLKYKVGPGSRSVRAKHNRLQGEGAHLERLDDLLSKGAIAAPELRFLAASYGQQVERTKPLDPEALGWPVRRLPAFLADQAADGAKQMPTISETLLAEAAVSWDRTELTKGSAVGALIDDGRIRIVPQAMTGSQRFRTSPFAALGPASIPERFAEDWLSDVVAASCTPIRAWEFSAWSELVPVMYALFALLRPRRYVELGVHNGMSYFAACQIAERLGLATECIAIDSWVGDEHAGLHDSEVFDRFRSYLAATYPDQYYIHAYFQSALRCFDDGSIDLLHIDGLHTYEAVKEDFETYLPKLSDVGVIIFHDINEFGRGFGVWRLWEELKERYPAYAFAHQHGLGIIFVGREPHPFATLLRAVQENRHHAILAQTYFQTIGALLVEQRNTAAALDAEKGRQRGAAETHLADLEARFADLQAHHGTLGAHHNELLERFAELQAHHGTLGAHHNELLERFVELQAHRDAVVHSTTWRATAPVRALLTRTPGLRRLLRRA